MRDNSVRRRALSLPHTLPPHRSHPSADALRAPRPPYTHPLSLSHRPSLPFPFPSMDMLARGEPEPWAIAETATAAQRHTHTHLGSDAVVGPLTRSCSMPPVRRFRPVTTTTVPMAVEEHGQGQPQPPTSGQMEVELASLDAATGGGQHTKCADLRDRSIVTNASRDLHLGELGGLSKYRSSDDCWLPREHLALSRYTGPAARISFSARGLGKHTSLRYGKYVVAIGAAQTLGVLASRPYTFRLEAALGEPVVPLAWGGAGSMQVLAQLNMSSLTDETASPSSAHARRNGDSGGTSLRLVRASLMLAGGARLVIVQALSGRSEANSECLKPFAEWSERCYFADGRPPVQGDNFWMSLQARAKQSPGGAAKYSALLAETRAGWIAHHTAIFDAIARAARCLGRPAPKLLFLYTSACANAGSLTCFPQLVASSWVAAVERALEQRHAGSLTVRAVTHRGDGKSFLLPAGTCGCPQRGAKACGYFLGLAKDCQCASLHQSYYPTDSEHAEISTAILGALQY